MKKVRTPLLASIEEPSGTNPEALSKYYDSKGVSVLWDTKEAVLWRGEANMDSNKVSVILSLERVFRTSFMKNKSDEQSILAQLPYLQRRYGNYTYASIDHPIGKENEESAAGEDGYLYMIEANAIKNGYIPLSAENVNMPVFVDGYEGEVSAGPDCAIIGDVDPAYIIGAIPSSLVAFSLGINEKTFIKSPYYKGSFTEEKIKKYDIEGIIKFSELCSVYPELSMEEVYQRYLIAEGDVCAEAEAVPFVADKQITSDTTSLDDCISDLQKDIRNTELQWQKKLEIIQGKVLYSDSEAEVEEELQKLRLRL